MPHITIDSKEIERVQSAKVLGVTISDNLTCYIEDIIKKWSKRIFMLYQLLLLCYPLFMSLNR